MGHIPHKKLTTRRHNNSKTICEGCKKEVRNKHVVYFKGKYICSNCKIKLPNSKSMSSASQIGKPMITLDEALNKVYKVKRYGNGSVIGSVPSILAEKKVKLILVEENREKNESNKG